VGHPALHAVRLQDTGSGHVAAAQRLASSKPAWFLVSETEDITERMLA
jgi:hypothetical protein